MPKCELCGAEVMLPFTCAYCGKKYCVEHRLPEIHNCSGIPKASPSYLAPIIPEKESQEIENEPSNRDKTAVKNLQSINSNYDPPHKLGLCPKCRSMSDNILAYSALTISFRCNRCGVEFSQLKATPNEYCEVADSQKPLKEVKHEGRARAIKPESMIQKRSWTRKVMGLAITLIIVLSAAYFLSNYFISPIPSPNTSPATSPIAITGRVVGVVTGSVIGENVSGVEISVIDSKGNEVMTNKTNAMGCFSFSNLLQGSYTIQITVPYGYVVRSATSYSVTYSRDIEFRLQNLLVNPKTMHYRYTLRGVSSEIAFTVYEGMYDYLVSIENSTVSYVGQEPSPEEITRIVTLRYVNEGIEKGELHNLVRVIEQITPNEDDQVRIAISLVQNIPYGGGSNDNYDWKYPYEILYSDMGVCGEKSQLLVCLLRELGYGCSILEFTSQNHAVVGIACPSQYAYYSGYAFVECSAPTIITDWYGDYVGAGKLPSSPSYAIVIQDGKVMNSVSEEYQDAQTFLSLNNMGPVLDEYHYTLWQTIVSKYGIPVS